MRSTVKRVALLALALALLIMPLANAEGGSVVKGVYDALVAQNSDYSKTKAMYAEYDPNMAWGETLADDSITISVSNSDFMSGSWTFTLDGDYLASTMDDGDISGLMMGMYMMEAVGDYYGMNSKLMTGYVNGLETMGMENPYFVLDKDEAAGTTAVRIYAAGAYDMKELDEIVLDGKALMLDPLSEGFTSMAANCGKLSMLANGSTSDLTILLGEYGELDDLAYQSIINVVSALQPDGWEDFVANYTALADARTDGYTVVLNADNDAVDEITMEREDDTSYAILRFGAANGYDVPEPAEAPTAEALREGYFDVLANLETGTAGSSLKIAEAASDVCGFAAAYELYNTDIETLRANMSEVFDGMSEDEQNAFQNGFDAVRPLLDACLDDYEANRGIFEDAGFEEAMDMIMYDPLNRLAWMNLRDHTLTMGNCEGG